MGRTTLTPRTTSALQRTGQDQLQFSIENRTGLKLILVFVVLERSVSDEAIFFVPDFSNSIFVLGSSFTAPEPVRTLLKISSSSTPLFISSLFLFPDLNFFVPTSLFLFFHLLNVLRLHFSTHLCCLFFIRLYFHLLVSASCIPSFLPPPLRVAVFLFQF